jgi:hypothetical protein
MNLAAVTEEADASKNKLEKYKVAATERMKADRAKYLEHLQVRCLVSALACFSSGGWGESEGERELEAPPG